VGGLLGTILLGVFAVSSVNKVSGLIEGNVHQFLVQLLAGVGAAAFSFCATWLILKIMNHFSPVRVPDVVEVKGLDEGQFGEEGYSL
jgi:Amt family ammonium transporter